MIEPTETNTENYLAYGSIVSLMLDYNSSSTVSTLSYDPKGGAVKYQQDKDEDKGSNFGSLSDERNQKKVLKKIKPVKSNLLSKDLEHLISKYFLFSQGVFNENCFFYKFNSLLDIRVNYLNTLFLIIPACEYESLQKMRKALKTIKQDILNHGHNDRNTYQQSTDTYIKFKQEIQTNHEQTVNILKKKTFVNFGDCVQFLHISSGKILKFKKNVDDLKIYIELSSKMSPNTIFRILHGFNYQSENSTNVFFNLGVKIACGDKTTNREKFLANGNVTLDGVAVRQTNKILNNKILNNVTNTNLNSSARGKKPNFSNYNVLKNNSYLGVMSYRNYDNEVGGASPSRRSYNRNTTFNSNNFKPFGKKTQIDINQIVSDDKSFNQWKLIKFSNDFLFDDEYINSLDLFWIENCEKEVYLTSAEASERSINLLNKRTSQQFFGNTQTRKTIISTNTLKENKLDNDIENENILIQKQPDKEEKLPLIKAGTYSKIKKVLSEEEKEEEIEKNHNVPLNYFFNESKAAQSYYAIGLQASNLSDFKDPLGVFKFQIISENATINEPAITPRIGPISKKTVFRIVNVFSNKVLCMENNLTMKANIAQGLKFVNYSDIGTETCKNEDTLFVIETAYEQKKKKDENDEDNKKDMESNFLFKKTDTIRIRTKKFNSYLAVRQIRNENKAILLLTKNLSDLTIFKLSFLDEADKYELHFFEQLNWCFNNLLNYFKNEDEKKIDVKNYENIQHILITLKTMLKDYNSKKVNVNIDEHRTFDFLRNINQFNIISKLMDLFLTMWFKNYRTFSYEELDKILFDLFEASYYLEYLDYKKLISNKILKIITLIYDMDSTFIIPIQNELHYFFLFVGYIDKCTKFLIHILRNNHSLLLKLLSLDEIGKDRKIFEQMRNSLQRIIRLYNSYEIESLKQNFQSFSLLFDLLNVMLICNDEPFRQFYQVFFKDFSLFISSKDNPKIPNIEKNPILVDFFINDFQIYIRKKRFTIDNNNDLYNDDIRLVSKPSDELNENSSSSHNSKNNYEEIIECDITLLNYKSVVVDEANEEEQQKEKDILSKIISLNLTFYSNICLHDESFKNYLMKIFNMEIVNNYLNNNVNYEGTNQKYILNHDIRCSLIRIINFLYLKIASPLVGNMELCRNIGKEKQNKLNPNIKLDQIKIQNKEKEKAKEIDKQNEIEKIMKHIEKILEEQAFRKSMNDSSLLLHIFESCQYIMRHVYRWEDPVKRREKSFDIISYVLIILESYIGVNSNKTNNKNENDDKKNALINLVIGDRLNFQNIIPIISSEYLKIYEIFRNKFEEILTNANEKNKKLELAEYMLNSSGRKTKLSLNEPSNLTMNLVKKTVTMKGVTAISMNQKDINLTFTEDSKMAKKEIVIRISSIFLEFLKFLENEYIDRIEKNLMELKEKYDEGKILLEVKDEDLNNKKDDVDSVSGASHDNDNRRTTILMNHIIKLAELKKEFDDVINNNGINNSQNNRRRSKYDTENDVLFQGDSLDLLKLFYNHLANKKKEIIKMNKENRINYNLDNNQNITLIFLRCIHKLDIMDLKQICFEILYRLNSQYFIFFENLSNLVIFESEDDLQKFEIIKKHFLELYSILKHLFSTSILDSTIVYQIENFGNEMSLLCERLYDKFKWITQMDDLKNYPNIKAVGTNNTNLDESLDSSNSFNIKHTSSFNPSLHSNRKRISSPVLNKYKVNLNDTIPPNSEQRIIQGVINKNNVETEEGGASNDKEHKTRNKNLYFMNEFTDERVQLVQQVLFNLGFGNLLIKFMGKANDIIHKFSESDKNNPDFFHFSQSVDNIQKCLEDIYSLLTVFIKDNRKHQVLIEENIELILFPISLTNNITTTVMIRLSSFLLVFLRDFNLNELNNIENFIKLLTMLIHFDWKNKKELIPFWVEILKIVIKTSSNENFDKLIDLLNVIKTVLIEDIISGHNTTNDIISLKEILELILQLKTIYLEDYENKARTLLSLNDIINKFFDMISSPKQLSVLLNLVIKFIDDNLALYKDEFEINKLLKRKLIKIVCSACEDIKVEENDIYSNINNNPQLIHYNEFLGISLPKLYCIFNSLTQSENITTLMDNCSIILKVSEQFYQLLYHLVSINFDIVSCFFSESNRKDIEDVERNFKDKFSVISELKKIFYKEEEERITADPNFRNKNDGPVKLRRKKIETLPEHVTHSLERSEIFVGYWNLLRKCINSNKQLIIFHSNVRKLINYERENFIQNLAAFMSQLEEATYTYDSNKIYGNATVSKLHFLLTFHNVFTEFFQINPTKKEELFFFYWIMIHLMRYDFKTKNFLPENKNDKEFSYKKTPFNKELFSNKKMIQFAIKCISQKNLKCIDYEMLIYIKFINSYLNGLDDQNKSNLYEYFFNSSDVEKLFLVLKNILEAFKSKLVESINASILENLAGQEYTKMPTVKISTLRNKYKQNEFSMNKFENELNPYEEVIELINNLSENNSIIHNQMKDYLRYQYNSSKSLNFICILANILDCFTKPKQETKNKLDQSLIDKDLRKIRSINDDHRMFIRFYFPVIIKIIESLTKCCQGPSLENQSSLVKETKILIFLFQILFGLTYRKKINFDENGNPPPENDHNFINVNHQTDKYINYYQIDCLSIGLSRKYCAFLKYKLVLLLSVLTIGRKKGDKLYEIIHREIDFDILRFVLEETYKEILIEKKSEFDPDNLTFGNEIYSRFENFVYFNKNPEKIIKDQNHNFIIYEIGTFTYIIMNIYYENLTRPSNYVSYNQITKFKKIMTKRKTEIKSSNIFDSSLEFLKSFGRCFMLIFICCKHYDCGKKRNHEEDFLVKDCFERAYCFYFDYTPNIEIFFNGAIIGYYVKLFPICKYLTDDMKEEFQLNLDRTNTKSKLECLFKNVKYYSYILSYSQKLMELFKLIPIFDLFFNQYNFFRDVSMILSIIINFLIFSSLYRLNDDYSEVTEFSDDFKFDYGFLYKQKNIKSTKQLLQTLSLLQFLFALLIFLNYVLKNIAKFSFYEKNDRKQNEVGYFKRGLKFLKNMYDDYGFLYHLIYLIFAILGFSTQNYKYFSFLLVEIIPRSLTLMLIIKSFWIPRKQLIVTLFLFYLFCYYFVIFIYLYMADQAPTKDCYRFDDCFFTVCDQAFKNSNGIINWLDENYLLSTDLMFKNSRFWLDNLFAIVNIILVFQMVGGIIIDNFSALRQSQGETDEDRDNVCFICGLHRTELNKLYGNEEGYTEHIKIDHYFWNYMFLIFNLLKKNPKTLMGIDDFIFTNYNENQSTAWIPLNTCKKKMDFDNKENNDEKEKEEENEDD